MHGRYAQTGLLGAPVYEIRAYTLALVECVPGTHVATQHKEPVSIHSLGHYNLKKAHSPLLNPPTCMCVYMGVGVFNNTKTKTLKMAGRWVGVAGRAGEGRDCCFHQGKYFYPREILSTP